MGNKTQLRVTPAFYITLAISVLLIPIKWVVAWFAAILVHESFHYIALKMCGLPVNKVELGQLGAQMNTLPMSGWKEAVCSAAGPIGSLLLILMSTVFPRLALCGAFHGLFNLLPIYPLDGSRILHGCVGKYRVGRTLLEILEVIVLLLLILLSLWSTLKLSVGPIPLIICFLLVLRWVKNKNTLQRWRSGGTIE